MNNLVLTEIKKNIAEILLNRGSVKNALNLKTINELASAFDSLSADQSIRCIILGSKSNEAFCSGADLKEFSLITSLQDKSEYFEALAGLIIKIKNCPKPVVARVHGYALAGGLALVAASDIVLAANDAKFSLPELKVGMIPGIVMLALEEVIHKRALSYLAISANIIDADEALQIGLVSKIYDQAILDKKTSQLAEEISSYSKSGVESVKKMLNGNSSLAKNLTIRIKEMAEYSMSSECREGIESYLSKRKN